MARMALGPATRRCAESIGGNGICGAQHEEIANYVGGGSSSSSSRACGHTRLHSYGFAS